MGGDSGSGGFAHKPENDHASPVSDTPAPSFSEDIGVEPPWHAPLEAFSAGEAPPDSVLAAFWHYTDGDDAGPVLPHPGIMLADSAPPPRASNKTLPAPPPQAPKLTKPAKPAKPARPPKPKKQRDRWQKVMDTTDGKPGAYDIGWMNKVDRRVLKSIDGAYADDIGEAQIGRAIAKDSELAKIERERKKEIAAIRKTDGTTARKGAKDEPPDKMADAATARFERMRADREAAIRAQVENNARKRAASQTVSVPEQGSVRRADMQTLKRINYVSDVNTLSKDPEKTRKHLESIRAVKGTDMRPKKGGGFEKNPDAMLLSGDTADRFEMAGDEFATAHEGFSIPKTSVGFGTRGLHETRQGLGYLGHMLGTTFDLFAAENPNLKGPDGEVAGVNDVMLKTLGRDQDPTKMARTRMDYIPDEKIMAMGKRTAANANTAEDASMEKQVREQYREMSTTSTNVKNALDPEEKQQLREAQTEYFELEESRKREADLAAKLAKTPDDAALIDQLNDLRQANQTDDAAIRRVLDKSFGGFQTEIASDMAAASERHKTDTKHDAKWKQQELDVLQKAHDNFVDPAHVFGSYHKDKKTGSLVANDHEASNVSLMQYLDHGFVRDDGTDYAALKKAGKQGAVFNEDVVADLMRHGFQSGSYFGDTMHFDFVESQTNLVPGGRNPANMNRNRASPENELPDVVNVPTTPVPSPRPFPAGSVFNNAPQPVPPFASMPPSMLQAPGPTTMDEPPNPLAPPKSMLEP